MELTINGEKYSFKFGVKFIREIDRRMPVKAEGVEFGLGLSAKVLPELKSGNVNTLSNILYLAGLTEKPSPNAEDIDNYIDEVEDIEQLFDTVLKELSESNAGKLAMRNLNENLKKEKKKKAQN